VLDRTIQADAREALFERPADAAERLAELESVRARLGNSIAIKNPADSRAIQQLLTTHTVTKPEIVSDETSKQAQLKGRGPLLVTLLTFEHH